MEFVSTIIQAVGYLFAVVVFYYYYSVLSQIDYKKYFKIRTSTTTFDDVIGLDQIKEDLQRREDLTGLIFSGPPGTGKTMLARAIANYYSDRTFAEVYTSDVDSDIILSTIDYLVKNYSQRGLVIYLDECYSILTRFSDYFLRKLDGFDKLEGVLFICSTNNDLKSDRKDLSALTRKGRFRHYTFHLPPEELRRKYFEKYRPQDLEHLSILL